MSDDDSQEESTIEHQFDNYVNPESLIHINNNMDYVLLINHILNENLFLRRDLNRSIQQNYITKQELENFPTKTITCHNQCLQKCSICINQYQKNDVLRQLKCKHEFHIKCIDNWLLNHSVTCPICRQSQIN